LAISLQLDSIWLILLFLQPINAILGVFEGLTYSSQSFSYVRNVIIFGALFVYSPLAIFGVLKYPTLLGIWLPKVAFDVFRGAALVWKVYIGILPSLPAEDAPAVGKYSSLEESDVDSLDTNSSLNGMTIQTSSDDESRFPIVT
jgi:hypothetical protein